MAPPYFNIYAFTEHGPITSILVYCIKNKFYCQQLFLELSVNMSNVAITDNL